MRPLTKNTLLAFPVVLAAALLLIPAIGVSAEEAFDLDLEGLGEIISGEEEVVYHYPEIKPEVSVFMGYRTVDRSGAGMAMEYEHLDDFPVFGGELRAFEFPHRLHLELDVENDNDYFGDLRYAYRDIVLIRGLTKALYHNFENVTLLDLDESSSATGVSVTDDDITYGRKTVLSSFNLRLKTPHFPLHGYAGGWFVDKDGSHQQISLLGSGYYNDIVRTSQERDMDYDTRIYVAGANSHLGPIEMDISHTEKSFDAGADKVMYDTYDDSLYREAGEYPHNQISDFEGSTDSIKLHSAYTGRLVASATLKRKENENMDSGVTADYLMGLGRLTWTPAAGMSFVLKYARKELDVEGVDDVSISDSTGTYSYTYDVDPSVSSTTDIVSLTGKYTPYKRLTLKGRYRFEETDRTDAELWGLEDSTRKQTALLSANARVFKKLTASASYTYKKTDDPSYNTESDRADEGLLSLSWMPLPEVNALFSYGVSSGQRDDLSFTDTEEAEDRDVLMNNLMGSCTFLINGHLTMTATYAYMRYEIDQDIVYETLGGVELVDPDVDLRDTAHVYAAHITYIPKDAVTLNAGLTHTRSSGEFMPESEDLLEPESVASYSQFKVRQTDHTVSGDYEFLNGYKCGLEYTYSNFNDELDNDDDDVEDGDAHIVIFTVSKKW
jgi:predicted porin